MLAHQHSNSVLYSSSQSKKKELEMFPFITQSSPLLRTHCDKKGVCGGNGITATRPRPRPHVHEDCNHVMILEPIEIKELCQSPKSSRHSMFSFSPTPSPSPKSSPELQIQHNRLSVYHSDDSSQSSPECTPFRMCKTTPPISTDRRRYMVIDEIISTETKYIDNLNTILSVFMPAFEHLVAARDLRLLIPAQLEMLIESHQDILRTLKQRMSTETKFHGFIGDIFSRLCGNTQLDFFNMYRVYMGEFKIAMKTLAAYETEFPQFKEILTLLQQSPLCERLSLASYLLTPIQRLPRYELLLKELLKSTTVDHPDRYYVGEALSRLHKELTKLNLSIKSCQMACPSPANRKSSFRHKGGSGNRRNIRRRPSRTMSVLKKFMSATNIDDYSSGDSSFTTDDIIKPPALRLPRRSKRVVKPSLSGSDCDLSASLGTSSTTHTMFRRGTLTPRETNRVNGRAVSCSNLHQRFDEEEEDEEESDDQDNLPILTPLASENCTPNSSRHSSSVRNSDIYSSNSSLSSLESNSENARDGSLTPTASPKLAPPTFTSTPTCLSPPDRGSKDSTLKVTDTKWEEPDNGGSEGSLEKENSVVVSEEVTKKKSNWRMNLFKKRKKYTSKSTSELKYIKQQET